MDRFDTTLREYFDASRAPADLRLTLPAAASALDPEGTAARFVIDASERGVRRVALAEGRGESLGDRRHAERARQELAEYLAGSRTFFSVPVDLSGLAEFESEVLAAAARIPYGETTSYTALADAVGRPRAARAVGNACHNNPVAIIIPCHRVVAGGGKLGGYGGGLPLKRRLLALEHAQPADGDLL